MQFTRTYKHFALSVLYWTQTLGATLVMVLIGWILLLILTVGAPIFFILEKTGKFTLDREGDVHGRDYP